MAQQGAAQKYYSFRPHWRSFSVYIFGCVLLAVGPRYNPEALVSPALGQLLSTCFLAFILIKRFTNLYGVRGNDLVWQSSFPKSNTVSVPVERIGRIDLRRGITQRTLNVAHVHIYRQGENEPAIKLFGVADPTAFRAYLLELGAADQKVHGAWRK